ncbi:hypothetical protein MTR_6g043350 [Medicago truncatula]|uniref:Uncharacterized protein n=1 Tax=Medicago truncatula TaxID=3880 RepID=A0A072U8F8_MEDTR|nr:hypothetical protein MTR_6g043350 [Medicago truncatula]
MCDFVVVKEVQSNQEGLVKVRDADVDCCRRGSRPRDLKIEKVPLIYFHSRSIVDTKVWYGFNI